MSDTASHDPHAPSVEKMARAGDWAGLLMYWLGHDLYAPALDSAIDLVEERAASEGGRYQAWTAWLLEVRREPLRPWGREVIQEHADPREEVASQLILSLPYAVLCETHSNYPTEQHARLLKMGIDAAHQASLIALGVGHLPTAVFFRLLYTRGLEARRQLESACEGYRDVLKLYRELIGFRPGVFESRLALALNNLGLVLRSLQRLEEAADTLEEARNICRELARDGSQDAALELARTLSNLGLVLSHLNQPTQARLAFEEALRIGRNLAVKNPKVYSTYVAGFLNNLGAVLRDLNHLEQARETFEEGLSYYRELAQDRPSEFAADVALTLTNLGAVDYALDRLEPAIAAYEEALIIRRELTRQQPEAHAADLALTLNNLGNAFGSLGENGKALVAYTEALAIRRLLARSRPTESAHDLALTLNNCSTVLRELDQREEAFQFLDEALTIRRELASQQPEVFTPYLASSLTNMGTLLLARNQPEQARVALEEAAECYARNALVRPSALLVERGKCLAQLGYLHLRPESHPGCSEFLAARDCFRQVRDCTETFRFLFADASHRTRVQTETIAIYDDLIRVNVALQHEDPHALTEALLVAESGRARNLVELLADQELTPADTPADLVERFRSLRQGHRHLAGAYRDEQMRASNPTALAHPSRQPGPTTRNMTLLAPTSAPVPSSVDRLASAREEFERVQRNYLHCLEEIRTRYDPGFDPDTAVQPISFEQAKSLLPDSSTAIVQYCLTALDGLALVLTSAGVEAIELPDLAHARARQHEERWFAAQHRAQSQGHFADWASELPSLLDPIARLAVRPIWQALGNRGIRRLVICPSRSLHVFPLHACTMEDGRTLSDVCEVIYTPSLSILHRCGLRPRPQPERLVLIQDPTNDLLGTRIESASLSKHYPSRQILTGPEATREAVLQAAAQSEVLHYAGHAFFDGKEPLRSGLVLGSKDSALRSSWLSLADLFTRLHMPNNSLVVLSGCESGLVESKLVDEYVGLPSGFLYAGARCVVSTLWAVSDLSSALLMSRFHETWRAGQSVASALRSSQHWLREIPSRGQLLEEVLPPILAQLPDELRQSCLAQAGGCPEDRPFASPAFWAPYTAVGLAYPLPKT